MGEKFRSIELDMCVWSSRLHRIGPVVVWALRPFRRRNSQRRPPTDGALFHSVQPSPLLGGLCSDPIPSVAGLLVHAVAVGHEVPRHCLLEEGDRSLLATPTVSTQGRTTTFWSFAELLGGAPSVLQTYSARTIARAVRRSAQPAIGASISRGPEWRSGELAGNMEHSSTPVAPPLEPLSSPMHLRRFRVVRVDDLEAQRDGVERLGSPLLVMSRRTGLRASPSRAQAMRPLRAAGSASMRL